MHRAIIITFITCSAISSSHAQTTWFVDDDNCPGLGNGTKVDPFCTIQLGIDAATDGDTVLVRPGVYQEHVSLFKNITLESETGPESTSIVGFVSGLSVVQVGVLSPGAILHGFTITGGNGASGIELLGGSPTIRGNIVTGNVGTSQLEAAIRLDSCESGAAPFIVGNIITHNQSTWGIRLFCEIGSTTILGNIITSNKGGIWVEDIRALDTVTIVNNLIYGHEDHGIAVWDSCGNTLIRCCTIANNESGALVSGSVMSIRNSIFWNTFAEIVNVAGLASVAYSNIEGGMVGTGNIDAEPAFANQKLGNYRISSGSPCIDAGQNSSVPAGILTDLDGNRRFVDDPETPNNGNGTPPIVDMGAYEYQTASIPTASEYGLLAMSMLLVVSVYRPLDF